MITSEANNDYVFMFVGESRNDGGSGAGDISSNFVHCQNISAANKAYFYCVQIIHQYSK
jgi:hypothetical protein